MQDYTSLVAGEREVSGYFNPGAGEQTPAQRGADANARALERIAERDLPTLADLITEEAGRFIRASAECRADARFLTSNGIAMSVPVMTAALLGEQVIHGLDIGRAAGTHWPISRDDALAVIDGVMAMVPDYIDRQRAAGKHVTYELRFRGGPTYWLRIDDGSAALGEPGGRADCWISADPVAFLLVGYGRVGQWGQILRGRLVAGGRVPWHGFAFGAQNPTRHTSASSATPPQMRNRMSRIADCRPSGVIAAGSGLIERAARRERAFGHLLG